MRYPGRFLKNRTPPTVDRRGVPVGLSILLLIVIVVLVVFFWRRRSEVSTILIDEKSNNKVILISYIPTKIEASSSYPVGVLVLPG